MMSKEQMVQKANELPAELKFYRACLMEGIEFEDHVISINTDELIALLIKHDVLPDIRTMAINGHDPKYLDEIAMTYSEETGQLMKMGNAASKAGDEELTENITAELNLRKHVMNNYSSRCLSALRNYMTAGLSLSSSILCQMADDQMGRATGVKLAGALGHLVSEALSKLHDVEELLYALSCSDPNDSLQELNEQLVKGMARKLGLSKKAKDLELFDIEDEEPKTSTDKDGWDYRIDE